MTNLFFFLKTKGAMQPHGYHAAYQLLCLCNIDSIMSVLQKDEISSL